MNISDTIASLLKRMRYGANIDPVRDWLVVLTLSIIVLACIVVWNVWAFSTVASGGAIGTSSPKAAPIFDPASLNAIHTIFAARADEEARYVTGVYRYADPSQ